MLAPEKVPVLEPVPDLAMVLVSALELGKELAQVREMALGLEVEVVPEWVPEPHSQP